MGLNTDGGALEFYFDTHHKELGKDELISIIKRTLDYGDDLFGAMMNPNTSLSISYPLANWNGNAKRIREYLKSLEGV
jgi:hypothetical protein